MKRLTNLISVIQYEKNVSVKKKKKKKKISNVGKLTIGTSKGRSQFFPD